MGRLELDLAGAMALRRGERVVGDGAFGGRQLRLVTAMLLLDRAEPVPVDRLSEALWPLGAPDQFRPALRGLVSKVRRLLADVGVEDDRIVSRSGRYVVDLQELRVDVEQAGRDLQQARRVLQDGALEEARDWASAARAVVSRPILPGVDAGWVDDLRDVVGGQLLDSLLVLGECRWRLGQLDGARSAAGQAVGLDPLREDAWRLAMRVEQQAGNTAAALAMYEQLRARLVDQLGVDPSAATRKLHARMLRQESPLATDPAAPGTPVDREDRGASGAGNPYVGLRPFDVDDAGRYFGREAAVQHLVDRVATHRCVVVVGQSGVGKSSLVRAGLLPALATGALPDGDLWRQIVMTPGANPVGGLADQLTTAGPLAGRVDADSVAVAVSEDVGGRGLTDLLATIERGAGTTVLVVDQAEELFTQVDEREAGHFIDALLAAVAVPQSPLVVVMTLRADFYERAARHPGLADVLSRSQVVVSPLQGDGLQLAITEPARRVGVGLEDGVLGRLVSEAGTGASGLPLLQHALWQLWRRSDDDLLSLAALDAIGGVAGALVEHAERAWAELGARQRRIARTLLLRSVMPGVAGATATPVARSDLDELGPPEVVDGVVAALVDARLVTAWRQDATGRAMLQVSHEALISAWPRLGGWVDAQRAHLQVAARLTTAAEQWSAQQRHEDWLLTGRRLDDALDLAAAIDTGTVDVVLSATESALLAASEQARTAKRQRTAQRRAHERDLQDQAVRHLRVGLALSAADNALDIDPERTLLLCLAVADEVRAHTPEHEPTWLRLLHHGLANHVLLGRLPNVGPLLAVLPDGRLVTGRPATAGSDEATTGMVEVRDRHTGDVEGLLADLGPAHPTVADVDVTGSRLALGATNGRVHVIDLDTLDVVRVIDGPDTTVGSVTLSPGGTHVAGLWFRNDTRQLVVVDAVTGSPVHSSSPVTQPHGSEAFSQGHQLDFHPSESRLLVATGPKHSVLQLLDTTTWSAIAEHDLRSSIRHVQHTVDGTWLGTAHQFGLSIHDAATLNRQHVWRIDSKMPTAAWIEDGSELVSAGTALRRFTPRDLGPRALPPIRGREPSLHGWIDDRVLLAVPGTTEMVTGRQHSPGVRRWDVGGDAGPEVTRLTGAAHSAGKGAWSPDGSRLAQVDGGSVVIWDVDTWNERARQLVTDQPRLGGVGYPVIENIAWSRCGRYIFAPASGGIFVVLDGETGAFTHVRRQSPSFFSGDTDVSSDGRWIVATHGSRIEVLDGNHALVQQFESPHGSSVEAAAFSPDGRWLATTHWPTGTQEPGANGATVWDWRSQEVVAFLPGLANNLSWSPDGDGLAVSLDGRTIMWDVARDAVIHELVGHRGWVQDVTHSPDGTIIATGGWDGDVRLWDAATGTQTAHFTGDVGVHRLRFHPNRPWLAIGRFAGTVHVWTLDTEELVDIARSRVTRELQAGERQRFLEPGPDAVSMAASNVRPGRGQQV